MARKRIANESLDGLREYREHHRKLLRGGIVSLGLNEDVPRCCRLRKKGTGKKVKRG